MSRSRASRRAIESTTPPVDPKALSSVAADDELTQISTAAEDLELDGDGAEWHRYLVKRIDGVLETIASQGTIEQDIAPIQNPTVAGNWRR